MDLQDFLRHPKRLRPEEVRALALLLLAVALVVTILVVGNYFLAQALPPGGDFSLLRTAGRSFLFERIEPYSANVPASVQREVYGRLALPGEKPYILDVPFHIMPLFFPLALIPDAAWARSAWLVALEIALLAWLVMSLRLAGLRAPSSFAATVIACLFGAYASVAALQAGSVSILLAAAYAGILVSLRAQLDELAGVLCVLAGFEWQVGGPFLLFVILSAIWARRWRVLVGAGMMAFVLGTISVLIYPEWMLPFLRAAWNNLRSEYGLSTGRVFTSLWPEAGGTLAWALAALLALAVGAEWGASRGTDFRRVVWVACLTLACTPLLGVRMQAGDHVMLYFPILTVALAIRERWRSTGTLMAVTWVLLLAGTPWMVSSGLLDLPAGLELAFETLFLPALSILGLYWIRWWMVRAPRTWMDQFDPRG